MFKMTLVYVLFRVAAHHTRMTPELSRYISDSINVVAHHVRGHLIHELEIMEIRSFLGVLNPADKDPK
ncbi:MAG: hypothetical protein HQM16_17500 [Deltaproteobacteria bacterium]|nr:hypothetical protein [Deltaproteobacteria bacterium]